MCALEELQHKQGEARGAHDLQAQCVVACLREAEPRFQVNCWTKLNTTLHESNKIQTRLVGIVQFSDISLKPAEEIEQKSDTVSQNPLYGDVVYSANESPH